MLGKLNKKNRMVQGGKPLKLPSDKNGPTTKKPSNKLANLTNNRRSLVIVGISAVVIIAAVMFAFQKIKDKSDEGPTQPKILDVEDGWSPFFKLDN